MDDDARDPWDRRPGETSRSYAAFRRFRDLGPLRQLDMLVDDSTKLGTVRNWSSTHDWRDRADAWDDATHRMQDARRLEDIRKMHDTHARMGRAVYSKAFEALMAVDSSEIPPYVAGRLLDVGTTLERDTLTVSVEDMQGVTPPPAEDPWETIARELDGVPET